MRYAAHSLDGFRASPRLYRGKVLLFVLAIAVVSLAEALRSDARQETATPAEAEVIERVVLDESAADFAPEADAPATPEHVCREVAGPFVGPLAVPCAACGCTGRPLLLAPRAS